MKYIDFLLKYIKEANILPTNTYLFAYGKKSSYSAYHALRTASDNCGAKMPTLLRSTLMRKQVAT